MESKKIEKFKVEVKENNGFIRRFSSEKTLQDFDSC
jgi:hypothetical protein